MIRLVSGAPGFAGRLRGCLTNIPLPARIASLLWLACCAYAFSNAGVDFPSLMMALLFAGSWMLVWLTRLLLHAFRMWRHDVGGSPAIRWWFEPAMLALGIALSASGALSSLRFALSESALDAYVTDVRAGRIAIASDAPVPTRCVGLYEIQATGLLADGTVRVVTSASGLLDSAGFANSPGVPPNPGEASYRHLHGAWWNWQQSW